jgi:lysophospholipid acyltransferase
LQASSKTSPKVSPFSPHPPSALLPKRKVKKFTNNSFPDSRRLIRPFFLSPDGSKPTAYKRYYDIFTCIITHLVFDFTTTPFILLSVSSTLHVWRQLYFYPIIGVLACSIFLASPGKKLLAKRVRAYTGASSSSSSRPGIKRNESMESLQGATMGIPVDPERELDELVEEVLEELRRRTGQMEIRVDAPEVKKLVQEKLLLRKASSDAVAPRAAEEKKSL